MSFEFVARIYDAGLKACGRKYLLGRFVPLSAGICVVVVVVGSRMSAAVGGGA